MSGYDTELVIDASTDTEDLVEFVRKRTKNPFEYKGTTVYNFSTHEIDKDALEQGINNKYNRELYQIPMQILTGQFFVQSILPAKLKEAEVLIYNVGEKEYYAYKNFTRDTQQEYKQKIREELAEIIRNHE